MRVEIPYVPAQFLCAVAVMIAFSANPREYVGIACSPSAVCVGQPPAWHTALTAADFWAQALKSAVLPAAVVAVEKQWSYAGVVPVNQS